VRLNRFLAAAGVGSRRKCDELIAAGRVTINGRVSTNFSAQPSERDHVKVDRKLVHLERAMTIALYKPAGRLDAQSEGLLLLTNDGDLAQQLTHPRFKIEKEYEVTLDRQWDSALAQKLLRGIFLDGRRAQIAQLHSIGPTRVRVVLRQGINQQIRRMFYAVGYEVKRLVRARIGNLRLGDLPRGHWRAVSKSEVDGLRRTSKTNRAGARAGKSNSRAVK